MKVIWAPIAEARALEAVDFIARDRPARAAAWLEKLLERTATLGRFPRQGHRVPELDRAAYREILHEPYRVIYRLDARQVVILTLRHVRRAWDHAEIPDVR